MSGSCVGAPTPSECLVKGDDNLDVVQQELLLHSSMRTSLWLEQADGVLVLPQSDHLAISDSAIRASMALNPNGGGASETGKP